MLSFFRLFFLFYCGCLWVCGCVWNLIKWKEKMNRYRKKLIMEKINKQTVYNSNSKDGKKEGKKENKTFYSSLID